MKSLVVAVAMLIPSFFVAGSAHAMYCGNRLVTEGDSAAQVRGRCGAPADVQQRTESRSRSVARRLPDGTIVYDNVTITVQVEVWTYDFGSTRFMRELTFQDGQLRDIQTLGYGSSQGSRP